MSSRDPAPDASERRPGGLLRIPYVRRCELRFDDGTRSEALVVNLNVLGAYLARDEPPRLGQGLVMRFGLPGSALEVEARGVVAWVNQRQEHPVHSLPLGFGVRFFDLPEDARARIAKLVSDYVRRQRGGR